MPAIHKVPPHEQEELILNAAVKCIENSSLLDFTMSSISKECELSMGSIYKHIQSKEDVLVALGTRMFEHLFSVFKKVLALPLPGSDLLVAAQLIDFEKAGLYSFGPLLETLVSNEAVLQRASKGWLEKMIKADEALEAQFCQILNELVDRQELQISDQDRAQVIEEIQVSQWSLSVGFTQVAMQRHARHLVGTGVTLPFPLGPVDPIVKSATLLINSYPWKTPATVEGLHHACTLLEQQGLR
jgi:AcrR family transcriptional regulator